VKILGEHKRSHSEIARAVQSALKRDEFVPQPVTAKVHNGGRTRGSGNPKLPVRRERPMKISSSTEGPFSLALAASVAGCSALAVATAPAKQAANDDSPAAKQAEAFFWSTLHGGRYDEIGPALDKLQAAYLAHPTDSRTAAHIGFLHIWRVSERVRQVDLRPTITDDIVLARRYFEESVKLDPSDARIRGFLASAMLAEGQFQHDEKLTRAGFFAMNDAVDAWPEFNLFTRGYTMSGLAFGDPKYADALDDQWTNLDKCADGARVDRSSGAFARFMHLETKTGPKRACWNSWIAPHNFEGFFLNMGDMIVKAGDPAKAREVYAQAKLAKEYSNWPYRDLLDRRITQADENVTLFRASGVGLAPSGDKERHMMAETAFACAGCHQET
jgi:hypothetical protein